MQGPIRVHLVDGTYELYRQHFGAPSRDASPNAATVGALQSTLRLFQDGATHLAVATDHVIESFRNDLYPGYKTSEGMEPELLRQIPLLEDALRAMGVTVWATVREEADDALASGVKVALAEPRVAQVRLLTPDKDLAQCVRGRRVIQVDRRNGAEIDEEGVREKYGVGPASIPDYLALVGDSSDGFPGLPGWGAKSAAAVLARYRHVEAVPDDHERWAADGVAVRGAAKLAATLRDGRGEAALFKRLATLVETVEVGALEDWRWRGPTAAFPDVARDLGADGVAERAVRLAEEPPTDGGSAG